MARRNKKLNKNKGLTFDLGGKLMADAKTSTSNNFSAGNAASSLGGMAGGLGEVIQGVAANSKINDEQVKKYDQGNMTLANYQSNAVTNEDLLNQWNTLQKTNIDRNAIRGLSGGQVAGNIGKSALGGMKVGSSFGIIGAAVGAIAGAAAGGIGAGVGSARARKAKERLEREQNDAYNIYQSQLVNNANNIAAQTNINALANYSAYGGPIFTHGGEFSNGITFIDNGGTHEENPMEGVPMGMSEDGIPNLVEEGEVKYNDYIFSNRLKANKELLTMLGLPKSYKNKSFSYIAKKLSKESEERPNDSISKAGLENAMFKLQEAQELIRQEDMIKKQRKYAKGGRLFDAGGYTYKDYENYLTKNNLTKDNLSFTDWERDLYESTGMTTNLNPDSVDWNKTSGYTLPKVNPLAEISGAADEDEINSHIFDTTKNKKKGNWSWLRYAPAIAGGINALTDAIGWTNKPDYKNADLAADVNLDTVASTPIGNYLTYRPFDRNYYLNKLNAQAAASRRAIMNNANGNRATALAGILASDYNTIGQIGDLARQAEEYNFKNRMAIEDFNRGTNMFNSEQDLKARTANMQNNQLRVKMRDTQAKMREAADMYSSNARATNLTNFIDSLGDIGRENFSRNMINSDLSNYYSIDSKGNITYKKGFEDLSDEEKQQIISEAESQKKKKSSAKKSKGGYLTLRRR